METSRLPVDIKQLLIDHIFSVSQLEMLFLFHENSEQRWNTETISRELRSNPSAALQLLQKLHSQGFIKICETGEYVYSPSPDLKGVVERIHSVYKERPSAIISFLYEIPSDKLKGFADAFRFKKD